MVDQLANDYKNVMQCCDHFTRNGQQTEILPKIHRDDPAYKNFFADLIGTKYEGKCPDFRIDGKYYELEGFTSEDKDNTLRNMLNRGKKQSKFIVIEDDGSTNNHIRKVVKFRKKGGQEIEAIWKLKENGELEQVV